MILTGGTVVSSLDPLHIVWEDVHVAGDRIAADGGAERRDCSGCLIVPGNVCAHTHLYSALARGMPYTLDPPEDFVQVLQRVWWRLDRALDEKAVRASALVGGMEALLSGTTTVIDHHASPNAIDGSLDVIADALAMLGVRSILCYETSDRDGPERARAGLAENRRFAQSVGLHRPSLTRGMIGAHASFTLSDDTLEACADAARAHGVGVHVHAAEDTADEDDAVMLHGLRVAARLAHAGVLDPRTLLAHGVHLDENEVGLIEAAHVAIAHNARSNMNNSIGRARVAALGSHVALGTDGIGADMFEESRAAYFRLREDDLASPPSWPLERLAEGASFAGAAFGESRFGRLEPGAPADLVVLDYDAPAPLRESSFAGHWIFGLSSRHVRDVMVAGEWVVRDRKLTRVDQQELAAEARVEAERLWKRLDDVGAHTFQPKGGRPWPSPLSPAASTA
jgi:putative selenium metabolism protein SsnA